MSSVLDASGGPPDADVSPLVILLSGLLSSQNSDMPATVSAVCCSACVGTRGGLGPVIAATARENP